MSVGLRAQLGFLSSRYTSLPLLELICLQTMEMSIIQEVFSLSFAVSMREIAFTLSRNAADGGYYD